MTKVKNFNETIEEIRKYLPEYLEKQNINTGKNFNCINPSHKDGTPSMSLIRPDNIRVYCHGCSSTGDIFDVCAWIEKKPIMGEAFVSETLKYLANMFNVSVEETEISEDEQYKLDTYRAYKHAHDYITNWNWDNAADFFKKEIERRAWPLNDVALRESGVGFIADESDYRNFMKSLGYSVSFLKDVDLDRKDLFSKNHMIFTVKDEHGRPVGFAARDLEWTKGKGGKYINQKTTGVKCNIYQKGKRLYGLDMALRHSTGPLYIVEGYTDVLSCHLNGFYRVAATCGTALTDDHILLLKELGIYDIVLCFDQDTAGQEKTEVLLDTKFSNHKDISLKVLSMPESGDPDDFIRKLGINAFTGIVPISAFKWRLYRFEETIESETVCKMMMPFVVSEPSHISREKMLTELSKFTGVSLKTLSSELDRLVNEKDKVKDRERRTILDKMTKDLMSSPAEAEFILSETGSKLYNLKVKYDEDSMSIDSSLQFINDMKTLEESNDGKTFGYELGPDLKEFQDKLVGNWKGCLMVVGGKANAGKTSFLVKLSHAIANVPSNNALVIYHTIDDSTEQLLPKFICVAENSSKLEINQVKNPNYWKDKPTFKEISSKRDQGYSQVISLIREGRLVIKDATGGSSLVYAENLIKYYQELYPDREIIYVLDNFHKLTDFTGLDDERSKWKTMCSALKNIAVRYNIPILCTMEYTKLPMGVKPTNDNLSETVQIQYDANLILHLWNASHELGSRADIHDLHTGTDISGAMKSLPIIEFNFGKNKISDFKSQLYCKFFPASSDFKMHPLDLVKMQKEQVTKLREVENKSKRFFSEG